MYKPVECQSLEGDEMEENKKSRPFSRVIGNARLSSTGKSVRIHFFENNRFFVMGVDDIRYIIEHPTETLKVKEYEQQSNEKES